LPSFFFRGNFFFFPLLNKSFFLLAVAISGPEILLDYFCVAFDTFFSPSFVRGCLRYFLAVPSFLFPIIERLPPPFLAMFPFTSAFFPLSFCIPAHSDVSCVCPFASSKKTLPGEPPFPQRLNFSVVFPLVPPFLLAGSRPPPPPPAFRSTLSQFIFHPLFLVLLPFLFFPKFSPSFFLLSFVFARPSKVPPSPPSPPLHYFCPPPPSLV